MLLAIIFIWQGYKKGRDSGRNGILWGAICGASFIGIQLLVGLGIGILAGIGVAAWGWSPKILDDYWILISIISWIPAIITVLIIFKYLGRIPDTPVETPPPPPHRKP